MLIDPRLVKICFTLFMQMPDISAQQLELLFGSFPECLCIFNTGGQLLKVNISFCQVSGYTEAELISDPYINFIYPDDQDTTLKALLKMKSHELPDIFENRFLFKNSGYKWMSWNCFLLDENGLIHCFARDISNLKATEAQLLQTIEENKNLTNSFQISSKKLALEQDFQFNRWMNHIIENYTDGFFTLSKNWTVLAFNQMARRMINLPEDSLIEADFRSIFPGGKDQQLFAEAQRALKNNQTVKFEEFNPYLTKWLEITAYPYLETVTIFFKDISVRKKQELDLLRLVKNYKVLFADNPLPMWAYDLRKFKILMVNDSALDLYGYSRKEFLNLSLYDLRPESEHERLKTQLKESQIFKDVEISSEWKHQKKDGNIIYVDIASHMIELSGQQARLIVVYNVTARREAQLKLLNQNKRLREIAQLSSHDLRGPVASILGLISLFDKSNLDFNLNNQIIENLEASAKDLDQVIHAIVRKTHEESR